MKIWVDDTRPAPEGYVWCKSVNEAKNKICSTLSAFCRSCREGNPDKSLYIEEISLDHDAGSYFEDGGDYETRNVAASRTWEQPSADSLQVSRILPQPQETECCQQLA